MRPLVSMAVFVFAAGSAGSAGAQQEVAQPNPSVVSKDSLYLHAQRLVNEGKGAEGRGIVDSLFREAAPGTLAQAEALFWRASLATTSAEAERDYRQITVEHPLSRRAEDALLRLAQLELQRGERTLALAHLERLLREHGRGPARARGAYWAARVHFEMNDVARGCLSLSDARASLPSGDVELRNQIEYAG
ncbi:MAG: tetratricopeptide repeat protein, partial [Gemmatimonadaceae bacterium]